MENLEKLQELLKDMDVPKQRRKDIRWLARNLPVRNHDHPNFSEAMEMVKGLLKKSATESELYTLYVKAAREKMIVVKPSDGFDIMQRFQKGKPTTAYPGGFDIMKRWQREQEGQEYDPEYETGGFDIMKQVFRHPVKVRKP